MIAEFYTYDAMIQGPVVLSRDHHDVSGADSPFRETSNVTDGSKFTADMAVQNFIGDGIRGKLSYRLYSRRIFKFCTHRTSFLSGITIWIFNRSNVGGNSQWWRSRMVTNIWRAEGGNIIIII